MRDHLSGIDFVFFNDLNRFFHVVRGEGVCTNDGYFIPEQTSGINFHHRVFIKWREYNDPTSRRTTFTA